MTVLPLSLGDRPVTSTAKETGILRNVEEDEDEDLWGEEDDDEDHVSNTPRVARQVYLLINY